MSQDKGKARMDTGEATIDAVDLVLRPVIPARGSSRSPERKGKGVPDRRSSVGATTSLTSSKGLTLPLALSQRRVRNTESRHTLKRKLSALSLETGSLDQIRTKIEKLDNDVEALSIEHDILDSEYEAALLKKPEYRAHAKQIRDEKFRVREELSAENRLLREREVEMGIRPSLTEDNYGAMYWFHVDLYQDPKLKGKNRNRKDQQDFRAEAIKAYGSAVGGKVIQRLRKGGVVAPVSQLWCPVLKKWCDDDAMIAAHIVPQKLSSHTMDYLFGTGYGGRKFRADNCLILNREVEGFMDGAMLVLVPVKEGEKAVENRWRTKVLLKESVGKTELQSVEGLTLGDLDGVELAWKTAFRPAKRFLYYHYLMSHIRNKEYKSDVQTKDWEEMLQTRPFATIGPLWHSSHLKILARYCGLKDEDTEKIAEGTTTDAPKTLLPPREATEMIHQAVRPEEVEGDDEDDEDDE
jgi:hypothetical protein